MQPWLSITALGDCAVVLPCAGLVFAWLYVASDGRALAWRWLLLFLCIAGLVAVSKLIFMAWGLGIRHFDFTGLSGHSTMAALVWPLLLTLVSGDAARCWRWLCTAVGLLLALLIGASRLCLHLHSATEVVAGFVAGSFAALWFRWWYGERVRLLRRGWMLAASVLLVLPFVHGHRFPSERMLRFVAQHLSLNKAVYSRGYFHLQEQHGEDG